MDMPASDVGVNDTPRSEDLFTKVRGYPLVRGDELVCTGCGADHEHCVCEQLGGWRCLRCDWKQDTREPEPPFTEKGCGCCWDFQCPKCGGAVEHTTPRSEEVTCPCFRCGEVLPATKQWLVKTMATTPGWRGPFCEACKDIVLKEKE